MTLTVEIDHPDFEDDVEFDVAGILIKNKGKAELTEEQERLLVARRQRPTKEVFEGNQFVKVTGSSALSAKDLEGIIVESNSGPGLEAAAPTEDQAAKSTPSNKDDEGSDG
jgi:hypothetical protein